MMKRMALAAAVSVCLCYDASASSDGAWWQGERNLHRQVVAEDTGSVPSGGFRRWDREIALLFRGQSGRLQGEVGPNSPLRQEVRKGVDRGLSLARQLINGLYPSPRVSQYGIGAEIHRRMGASPSAGRGQALSPRNLWS